jgi:hypothetical protein
MHRYSSILIPHSVYHFPVRIASMTGCYVFLRRMGVGLDGMTNVALPHRLSGAAVYGPDFGYYQMELLLTQPCADLRALLLSEFVSPFLIICSLTCLVFFVVSVCRRCLSALDRYTSIGRVTSLVQGLEAPSVNNKGSTWRALLVFMAVVVNVL